MTTSSPTYRPGDLLRVPVLFTDQQRAKARPAVVVSVENVQLSRADVIIVPLSRKAGSYFGDRPIQDWSAAGLSERTYIKAILVTIEQDSVERVWGRLSDRDYEQVQQAMREILDLP